MELSWEAEALLLVLCREYMTRRAHGVEAGSAVMFGGSEAIRESYLPQWKIGDIDYFLRWLHSEGFVQCVYYDNSIDSVLLTHKGICYIESQHKNKVSMITQRLIDLAGLGVQLAAYLQK